MKSPKPLLVSCALLFSLVGALDVTLKDIECDESLPMYMKDKSLTMECDGEARCTLGSEATLHGKLQFSGVDEVGLVDGFAFVSASLSFLSLEYQLLQYLQVPVCGQYVMEDQYSEDECPADGIYEVYMPYVLPEEESKASWLASGWEGMGEVSFYSEANNINSLIGECQLHFSTAVTKSTSTSFLAKLPVPSAMVSMLVLLAFAAFLVLSCIYQLMRDIVTGKKSKKRKGLLDDDSTADGSHTSTAFTKMEEAEAERRIQPIYQ